MCSPFGLHIFFIIFWLKWSCFLGYVFFGRDPLGQAVYYIFSGKKARKDCASPVRFARVVTILRAVSIELRLSVW